MITKKTRSRRFEFSSYDIKKLGLAIVAFTGTWIIVNVSDIQAYFVSIGVGQETVALTISFAIYVLKTFITSYENESNK